MQMLAKKNVTNETIDLNANLKKATSVILGIAQAEKELEGEAEKAGFNDEKEMQEYLKIIRRSRPITGDENNFSFGKIPKEISELDDYERNLKTKYMA